MLPLPLQQLKQDFQTLYAALEVGHLAENIEKYLEDGEDLQTNAGDAIRTIAIEHLRKGKGLVAEGFRRRFETEEGRINAAADFLPEAKVVREGVTEGMAMNDYLNKYSIGNTHNEDLILNAICERLNIAIDLTTVETGKQDQKSSLGRRDNSFRINLFFTPGHYYVDRGNTLSAHGNGNCACNAVAEALHRKVIEAKNAQAQQNPQTQEQEQIPEIVSSQCADIDWPQGDLLSDEQNQNQEDVELQQPQPKPQPQPQQTQQSELPPRSFFSPKQINAALNKQAERLAGDYEGVSRYKKEIDGLRADSTNPTKKQIVGDYDIAVNLAAEELENIKPRI